MGTTAEVMRLFYIVLDAATTPGDTVADRRPHLMRDLDRILKAVRIPEYER